MKNDSVAPLEPTKTYKLNGITIVPHYTAGGIYVGPKNVQYTEAQLIRKGAVPTSTQLWPRARGK